MLGYCLTYNAEKLFRFTLWILSKSITTILREQIYIMYQSTSTYL